MKQIPINSEDTVGNNNVPITGPKHQPGSNAVGPRASAGACIVHAPRGAKHGTVALCILITGPAAVPSIILVHDVSLI